MSDDIDKARSDGYRDHEIETLKADVANKADKATVDDVKEDVKSIRNILYGVIAFVLTALAKTVGLFEGFPK